MNTDPFELAVVVMLVAGALGVLAAEVHALLERRRKARRRGGICLCQSCVDELVAQALEREARAAAEKLP